ncbi:MAG: hypothetical protein ACYC4D_07905 [Thermoleophilia bacterium]
MMPNIDVRTILCLDGLHYSFELLNYYYLPLHELCCELPSDNTKVIPVLASCWGFIDTLHRIRELAQSLPRLSVKHHEIRRFLNTTSIAEDYRHYIQHLRNELAKDPPNPFPVWGSLSWIDKENPKRSYIALFGAQFAGISYTGCVFDTVHKRWVSKVCLGIGGKSFNFDPIFDASIRFKQFVITEIRDNTPMEVTQGKLPIMTIEAI